ncbi:S24 family peptidase [Luteolibacter arcticus]|uniref:S24 family peptidase n=1 Tax=Luteolibacter arcticus TaxID=1581411 RepID=A0ABT3GSM6_9BACT|nr:S24 family peptidase [Luteolibacter arcticus]MCW1926533.1 S24 family peptidase [Luteolibacter arcticus]
MSSNDDPNFFKEWMDRNRLRAEDVTGPLQVSEQTIHNWRSAGVPARRVPHVQAFMESWADPREAAAAPSAAPLPALEDLRLETFIMRPSEEEFDTWNRAANAAGLTIREWISETLERAAEDFRKTGELPGDPRHGGTFTGGQAGTPGIAARSGGSSSGGGRGRGRSGVIPFPAVATAATATTASVAEDAAPYNINTKSTTPAPALFSGAGAVGGGGKASEDSSGTLVGGGGGGGGSSHHDPDRSGGTIHWIDLRGGVAAGAPISSHVIEEPVATRKSWPDDHYALQVFGRSMEPKIPDGAQIIVKRWPTERGIPRKGTIVVYSDGTGSSLKEFGYRKARPGEDTEADAMGNIPVLRSLNTAFPEVQTLEGGKIDAVLVEVG